MRRACKKDDNHREVVAALRKFGAFVQDTASLGQGVPDLFVAHNGDTAFFEVKDGGKVPSAQKLTVPEIRWILALESRAPVWVVTSAVQAVEIVSRWGFWRNS